MTRTLPAFIWVASLTSFYHAFGQPETGSVPSRRDAVVIGSITISGNKTTRETIIRRELEIHPSDTLTWQEFLKDLEQSRQNVFNTGLFNIVRARCIPSADSCRADVRIEVLERWYIWPIPFFEISERNFNVWLETRDLSRLTYGIDFTFNNARGRNETLKLLAHFGFNQKYGFTYRFPYINRKQTLGLGIGGGMELNHQVAVTTFGNKPVTAKNNDLYLKKMAYAYADLIVRPDFFVTHTFHAGYSRYEFDSAILAIPGFSLTDRKVQQFVNITYFFRDDHRDVQYYPLSGYYIEAELNHAIPYATAHNSYLRANLRLFLPLRNRLYWDAGVTGKISFEKEQPYYFQRGLGYGRDYVRGYELYVVDGQHYALLKTGLKFALLPQRIDTIRFIRSSKFNTIPLALYLNAFCDMGYAYHYPQPETGGLDQRNTLENSYLLGYGLGWDFTTYYDIVIRVEATMNLKSQWGVYLHFISPI